MVLRIACLFSLIFFSSVSPRAIQETYKVIIIGGGAAGVAAATKLIDNNFTDFLVLEAESYLGGRIHSVPFGNAFVDLGAEWVHGEKGNVVYELLKDLDVLRHTDFPDTIHLSSRKIVNKKLAQQLLDWMDEIYLGEDRYLQPEGVSVGDFLIQSYLQKVKEYYPNNPEILQTAELIISQFEHDILTWTGSFSWFTPSAQANYKDTPGDLNLNLNGHGYKIVLDILTKKYEDVSKYGLLNSRIMYNKEVVNILWDHGINHIRTKDGNIFIADHVIFTPSVGVLKSYQDVLFSPPLPPRKIAIIKSIGIEAVLKVFLHFKEIWWNAGPTFTGFDLVWEKADKEHILEEFPKGVTNDGSLWITDLFAIYPGENNQNVLSAWFTGSTVPYIENMPEEDLLEGINYVIHKFLGHYYPVTQPDYFLRSDWYSNPHFKGTYSFESLETRKISKSANLELSQPILTENGKPLLLFAGEATHPIHYSVVHGAIETGWREADRILNYYKKLIV